MSAWRIYLSRFVAAVLLLLWAPNASKVLCVSGPGHQTLEDGVALCCAPEAHCAGASFAEPNPCQGCTDYPLTLANAISGAHAQLPQAVRLAGVPPAVQTPTDAEQAAALRYAYHLERPVNSTGSSSVSQSLRC